MNGVPFFGGGALSNLERVNLLNVVSQMIIVLLFVTTINHNISSNDIAVASLILSLCSMWSI